MKKISILSITFCISVSSMQVHAENDNTKPLNLLDVYMLAKGQDAQFAAAEAALRAGKEVLPQSRAALKPSLRLDGNTRYIDQTTKYSGNVPFPSGTQSYGSYHYTLKLIQPIYHKNSIEAYKQARLSVESSETQFNLAQQNLITRVAQAYFDVLLAKDTLTLTEAEISSNEEQLARSKRAFDIGSATIMDVREAQASYDLSRAREISAKNGLEIARQTLSKIIGTYPQALVSIAGELPLVPPEPAIMENWVTAAQEQNLNVRLAQLNLQIAGREIQRNRGLAYPSLDLVANYIGNNSSSSSYGAGVNTKEKNIGLELNVPLYSGGLVSSKTRELVAEKERSQHIWDDTRRQAELQTQNAYLSVTSDILQIQALQQAVASSESSLEATRRGFDLGLRTEIDVLTAQQQLFSAKRDLASAKYDYLTSRLKLQAAVGTLSEKDLLAINELLK